MLRVPKPKPRRFSTAERVHPSYLPHLCQPPSIPLKWATPVAAAAAFGYCVKASVDGFEQAREQQRENDELRRRNERLMDAYAGRSTLEELEQAVEAYEKK